MIASTGIVITENTGLSEEEAKKKLLELIPRDIYESTRKNLKNRNLANTFPDNSWGFITTCIANMHNAQPHDIVGIMIRLLKEGH